MLKYILCPREHGKGLVKSCRDTFYVLSGMGWVWSVHVEIRLLRDLVNTYWDTFYVFDGMELVWTLQVEIHFVSSLAWDRFSQHMLRWCLYPCWHLMEFGQHMLWHIMCTRWNGRNLVNKCWNALWVVASMGMFWSTQVEIHFVSLLAWDGSRQHRFRYIFFPSSI